MIQASGPSIAVGAHSVQFTASPTNGILLLGVQFESPDVDSSGKTIVSWNWNFGDGSSSTAQNPLHIYTSAGTFDPILVTTNSDGIADQDSGPAVTALGFPAKGFATFAGFTMGNGAYPESGLALSGSKLYGTTSAGGAYGDGVVFSINTEGRDLTVLYNFTGGPDGSSPCGLALSGNILYGTASGGGSASNGTIFALNTDGTDFQVLHSFGSLTAGANADGAVPQASLTVAGNTLYGVASRGGTSGSGTIFSLHADGSEFTTVYNFSKLIEVNGGFLPSFNYDGANPNAPLVLSGNTLFGTAPNGGTNLCGTVFAIETDGSQFAVLSYFSPFAEIDTGARDPGPIYRLSSTNADGGMPNGGLVQSGNTLYGTAKNGGPGANGTVFQLNKDGTDFIVLYNFSATSDTSSLMLSSGALYGTTSGGGTFGNGMVFVLTLNDGEAGFKDLYDFNGGNDGSDPIGNLSLSGTTLFGMTYGGGVSNVGTLFSVSLVTTNIVEVSASPASGLVPLTVQFSSPSVDNRSVSIAQWNWNFGDDSVSSAQNPEHIYTSPDDFNPSLLVTASDGTISYGISPEIDANFVSAFTVLHYFDGFDGANPVNRLTLSGTTIYGATSGGGADSANIYGNTADGTIFTLSINGAGFEDAHTFTNGYDSNPQSSLATLGNVLYGTTTQGGSENGGTIFKFDTNSSALQTIYGFSINNGAYYPEGTLVLAPTGDRLYGTTAGESGENSGAIFAVNTNGTAFTILHGFSSSSDGAEPEGELVFVGNSLYGTAESGGTSGYGTVFAINIDGSNFRVLHTFSGGIDGANPTGGLIISGNTLYGTTSDGGSSVFTPSAADGIVFKVNTDGTSFTVLHAFSQLQLNQFYYVNGDGAHPHGGLTLQDNTLYGTASQGGIGGEGTIFQVNEDGSGFVNLHSFAFAGGGVYAPNSDGSLPAAGLMLASNVLYGTADTAD